MPTNDPIAWMNDELTALEANARRRCLRQVIPLPAGYMELDGRRLLNLSSNDYLGLAAKLSLASDLPGATASRLVVGNHPAYAALEARMADLKGTEAALVFGSGYLANIGTIPALVGRGDTIFADRLNHASLVDGMLLSRATIRRYRHNDPEHLASLLEADTGARKLIVTDAVFSMDGDVAPLAEIVRLKRQHGAMLMIDEAHSGGVFGARGEGLAHVLGLAGDVDVNMGTFSKAYGCYGAYVAGRRLLIDYLVNRARSFIFTTGLPPALVQTIDHAVERAATEQHRRDRLWELVGVAQDRLRRAGLDIGASASPIIPIVLGSDQRAVAAARRLAEQGIGVVAIRPPTVPEGTARLRLSLSAAHDRHDLEAALDQVVDECRRP